MSLEIEILDQKIFESRKLLKPEIKELWLKALRSGEFKQGELCLCSNNRYCCLGVLAQILYYPYENGRFCFKNSASTSGFDDYKEIGLSSRMGYFGGFTIKEAHSLANLNDMGVSFEEIANIIEKYF